MPNNKNALIRYQALDKCFRNPGRRYFWEELLEACNQALSDFDPTSDGIQRRQLLDDIRFMESEQGWSIPLERNKDGKRVFYRYADLKFSINNQPINETEANQLKSALLVLSRFKGLPQFEWINEIIPRFEQSFNFRPESHDIIGFDHNEYLRGIDRIGDLFNAVLYRKVLSIKYKPFHVPEPFDYQLHPYYLKQYNSRWFLLGYNPEVSKITIIALDRIENVEETGAYYTNDKTLNFQEYFEDIVGVSRMEDAQPIKVELFVAKDQVPYILTKPLHGSQKRVFENEEGLVISLKVIPNFELEQLILSHGEKIQVLSPEIFREKIKIRLTEALFKYRL
ncbi:MAG: WYL domain-containing protein [Saprospiraceae bacterium]|nr:WYL domain-containing protein [Saprospiraceae bacterium]MCB0575085.1 WYL domain-containing protein [Saprospiraceae bacterium]